MSRLVEFRGNDLSPKPAKLRKIKVEKLDDMMQHKKTGSSSKAAAKKLMQKATLKTRGKIRRESTNKPTQHLKIRLSNEHPVNGSPRTPDPNRTVVLNAEQAFKSPCPSGFKRLVVQREGGSSAGKLDTYYFSPEGKSLRSRPDISRYLDNAGIVKPTVDAFDFITGRPDFDVVIGTYAELCSLMKGEKYDTSSKSAKKARGIKRKARKPLDNNRLSEKVLKIQLKRCDYLVPTNQTPPSAESSPSGIGRHFVDCETDPLLSSPEYLTPVTTPRHFHPLTCWNPPSSPFQLIYEEPSIHGNLWKLMTASIIVFFNRLDAFVVRYTLYNLDWVFSAP
jgi:hypothetical protein